ncbi:MAG: transglutaminase domain-containing protein, partial [Planctomycetota bacterium JB042]
PVESAGGGLLRAAAAALLAVAVVAILPVVVGVEHAVVGARLVPPSDRTADPADERADPADPRPAGASAAGGPERADDRSLRYPDGLPEGARDGSTPAQSFGEVRVLDADLGGAPFLLRGNVLGLAGPGGFLGVPRGRRIAAAPTVPAHGTGGPLFDLADPAGGPEATLEIRHPAIPFRGSDRLLLLPAGTHAVRVLRPLRGAGRLLLERSEGVFTIPRRFAGMQVVEASVTGRTLRRSVAGRADRIVGPVRHPDPRWTELPDDLPAAARIAAFSRRMVSGARTFDDVRNVAAFLRREFVYDTSTPFDGLASVERLLNGRRGYCQHFALAATVMLRSAGLPARVATGFLVNDWDAPSRAYEVWSSDRHAWIEVHVEGEGWVPVDVTPGSVLADLRRLRGDEPGDEATAPPDDLEPFLAATTLEGLIDRLAAAPVAVARIAARRPGLALLALGAAGLLAVGLLRAGRTVRRRLDPAARTTDTRWARLLATLAARGLRPAAGQTPRQFAAEVARRRGEPYGPLVRVVDLFYRARFGRRPLGDDEERFVDTFIESIR